MIVFKCNLIMISMFALIIHEYMDAVPLNDESSSSHDNTADDKGKSTNCGDTIPTVENEFELCKKNFLDNLQNDKILLNAKPQVNLKLITQGKITPTSTITRLYIDHVQKWNEKIKEEPANYSFLIKSILTPEEFCTQFASLSCKKK